MTPSRIIVAGVCALVLMARLTAGAQTPAQPPPPGSSSNDHASLPAGPGRDLVIRVCSHCHLPEVVADQQFDKTGWKDLVDQMAGKGAEASDDEFEQIVQYLAKAFPVTQ